MEKGIITFVSLVATVFSPTPRPLLSPLSTAIVNEEIMAEHQLDLDDRNPDPQINEVFTYNILLALYYFGGGENPPQSTSLLYRNEVELALNPGEVFAFHESILPEFKDSELKTGWTRYTSKEGYKTVLGLPGNGVCHLASLINWTASDAGLEVVAKTNHNFYLIPGIPKEYGASIRYTPDGSLNSQNQNLYIRNNFEFPVRFEFQIVEDHEVNLAIVRENS